MIAAGVLPCVLCWLAPPPQDPRPEGAPPAPPRPGLGVRFDGQSGWPIVQGLEVAKPAGPGSEPVPARPPAADRPTAAGEVTGPQAQPGGDGPGLAAGAEPLPDVFAAVGSPASLQALGGATVWWRVTVLGSQGEPIGIREVTHLADLSVPDRDRLTFADGRVGGRLGGAVFAERHGHAWPTMAAAMAPELAFYGLHLRVPWAFADARRFAAAGTGELVAGGERLWCAHVHARGSERGPGPVLASEPVDRFELWSPPGSPPGNGLGGGLPRALVHEFAGTGRTRRALLEDWRPVGGVHMPFRRVYVDAAGRPTTRLEILRIETGLAVAERDFRLH